MMIRKRKILSLKSFFQGSSQKEKEKRINQLEQRIKKLEQTEQQFIKTVEAEIVKLVKQSERQLLKKLEKHQHKLSEKHANKQKKIFEKQTVKYIEDKIVQEKQHEPNYIFNVEHLYVEKVVIDKLEHSNNFGQLGIKELTGKLNIGSNYEGKMSKKAIAAKAQKPEKKLTEKNKNN
ncbi:hypothetical protein K6959_08975 [Bacillus aquiflavi]|uniref:hypothetical protein n=1 Tax=Bacillus aquiflavi TaxID=2672567 RepID=UPI001CA875D8|nr:hypothetical protein [Bacillus aquiflavi]UAC49875.1 hypothetical protein K6959_08975 [Bacillus aquiflavi]